MIRRELQKFICKNGLSMKGVIFYPEAATNSSVGVVYLPGSVLGSTAVHRLGIDICKHLASNGFMSFVFDQTNIGESEGELPSSSSDKLNEDFVIKGAPVGDTLEAINYFMKKANLKKVILVGHCGGGLTALYTTTLFGNVVGTMLISTPILWEGKLDFAASEGAVKEYSTLYKNRFKSIESWKKLLSGQSDYRLLLKFIRNKVRNSFVKNKHGNKLNKKFKESFDKVMPGKKVIFLMGDKDPGLDDFKYFAKKYLKPEEFSILKDTSHGFVTKESADILFTEIDKFVGSFS